MMHRTFLILFSAIPNYTENSGNFDLQKDRLNSYILTR